MGCSKSQPATAPNAKDNENAPANPSTNVSAEKSAQWVNPPPTVTAQHWAVVDGNTGELLFGVRANERKEIASITKIMTFYTVLSLSRRYGLDLKETEVTVSREASKLIGTRANVAEGDVFKAHDLKFGMMLPSGNDAAHCFAEHFGSILLKEAGKEGNFLIARKHFIHEMNINAKALGLSHTKYDNPTGLGNKFNKSTAEDVGKLCSIAMRLPEFREVVSCQSYNCTATTKEGEKKEYSWKNTNKMLAKGYSGIKTGITPSAGPCLASSVEVDGYFLIIILLNSKSMEARWEETEQLKEWAIKELNLKKQAGN